MIADWTVEVSANSPSIDLPWEGWVDLRWSPADPARAWPHCAADSLAETQAYPEMEALLRLANSANACTSKADVFPVHRDEVDPELAEAGDAATAFGLGSYVDLLLREPAICDTWDDFGYFAHTAREISGRLGKMEMPRLCCAEMVVRPAHLFDRQTYGWTIYTMGFGPTEAAARQAWAMAANAVMEVVVHHLARQGAQRTERSEASHPLLDTTGE